MCVHAQEWPHAAERNKTKYSQFLFQGQQVHSVRVKHPEIMGGGEVNVGKMSLKPTAICTIDTSLTDTELSPLRHTMEFNL